MVLPYTVSSSSGVMFDALAHNVPFVATNLEFFGEFSAKGLGITVKRSPTEFSRALMKLDKRYPDYIRAIDRFKEDLSWDNVAKKHASLYSQIISRTLVVPAYQTNNQTHGKSEI